MVGRISLENQKPVVFVVDFANSRQCQALILASVALLGDLTDAGCLPEDRQCQLEDYF